MGNDQAWSFDLSGKEEWQFTEYEAGPTAEENDFYERHMDVDMSWGAEVDTPPRRLRRLFSVAYREASTT